MKRALLPFLLAALLLSGCTRRSIALIAPVEFYYPCAEYEYGEPDGVIGSESVDATFYSEDLDYLLGVYLLGPAVEDLKNPFAPGTSLVRLDRRDDSITVFLSSEPRSQSDLSFSLGCTCLSMTVLELTDANQITVRSGPRTLTTTRNEIALLDDYMQ